MPRRKKPTIVINNTNTIGATPYSSSTYTYYDDDGDQYYDDAYYNQYNPNYNVPPPPPPPPPPPSDHNESNTNQNISRDTYDNLPPLQDDSIPSFRGITPLLLANGNTDVDDVHIVEQNPFPPTNHIERVVIGAPNSVDLDRTIHEVEEETEEDAVNQTLGNVTVEETNGGVNNNNDTASSSSALNYSTTLNSDDIPVGRNEDDIVATSTPNNSFIENNQQQQQQQQHRIPRNIRIGRVPILHRTFKTPPPTRYSIDSHTTTTNRSMSNSPPRQQQRGHYGKRGRPITKNRRPGETDLAYHRRMHINENNRKNYAARKNNRQ